MSLIAREIGRMAAEKAIREGTVVKIVCGGETVGFVTPQGWLPPDAKFVLTLGGIPIYTSESLSTPPRSPQHGG